MEPSRPPITQQLTGVVGLRFCGIFPKTKEKERTVISMSQLWSITREDRIIGRLPA